MEPPETSEEKVLMDTHGVWGSSDIAHQLRVLGNVEVVRAPCNTAERKAKPYIGNHDFITSGSIGYQIAFTTTTPNRARRSRWRR